MKNHIILTGPESSGKTTLSLALARKLNYICIPEYSRAYLSEINRAYEVEDLQRIAEELSDVFSIHDNHHVIFDTGFLVLKVWYEERFGLVPQLIEEGFLGDANGLYILCTPDMPWSEDPLRENPHDRFRLFEIYHRYLLDSEKTFTIVSGSLENRMEHALDFIMSNTTDQKM